MAFLPDPGQTPPEQIEVINPHEAALRQATGFTASGQPAPPAAMVDSSPGAPPVVTPKPTKFVPDAPPPKPVTPPARAPAAPQPTTAGDIVKGVGDAALSGVSKVATGVVGAPIALANRIIAGATGGDAQLAADATHEYVNRTFGHDTQTPVGKQIGAAVAGALAPLGQSAQADKGLLEKGGQAIGMQPGFVSNQLSEAGDIAGTVGAVAPLAAGAEASAAAEAAAARNVHPATNYGMRTLADHPIAAGMTGSSGTDAVVLHNQAMGNTALGAEAGVPHGAPITYTHLEGARTAPNQVYNRLETSLPTAPLSPAAQKLVADAGTGDLVTHTPDAQSILDTQKQRLLAGPLDGPSVVNNIRALRQEGGTRLATEDVEQQNLGSAQLDMARGLEQHVTDTLPPGSPVSVPQFQQARTAIAKNYAVQSALKGNNVDMQAIARIQRNDPALQTGATADIADFANQHPTETRLANGIAVPPGFTNDVGKAAGGSMESLISPAFWTRVLGMQTGARHVLTGNPAEALAQARQVPVSGLAGEFDELPPSGFRLQAAPGSTGVTPVQSGMTLPQGSGQVVHPTGGLTASPPTAPAPSAAGGAQGGISLADLLSHGVEQSPSPGLSLAPEYKAPGGIPFQRNAAHEAGPLSLVDDLIGPAGQSVPKQNNSDVAPVMSQGVPEGIVSRTAKKPKLQLGDIIKGLGGEF